METSVPCPRCGRSPVEVSTFGDRVPRFIPACACYPHPPLCVSCRAPLLDGLCANMDCPVYAAVQPEPITDPMWPLDANA